MCHSKESKKILETIKGHLGIDEGETTEDGLITLDDCSCIGQCDGAPAIMVNDIVHRGIDEDQIVSIIDDLKKRGE